MGEGLYEVDVKTLAVSELWADEQRPTGRHANLPGYHGKGFYRSRGRCVYANNGDHAKEALTNPAAPSGVLAEWDGKADKWTVVRRNQFTEVTGPGGIMGSDPDSPLWSIGWGHRSLILMLLDGGKWTPFRLPKSSHSYDGAHACREVCTERNLLNAYGTFYEMPAENAGGFARIRPVTTHNRAIFDYTSYRATARRIFARRHSSPLEIRRERA